MLGHNKRGICIRYRPPTGGFWHCLLRLDGNVEAHAYMQLLLPTTFLSEYTTGINYITTGIYRCAILDLSEICQNFRLSRISER